MTNAWTPEQNDIFDKGTNTDENLLIRALAGTGKSTTLAEMVRRYKEQHRRRAVVCLVFTVRNREDMAAKLDGIGECRTFNSWGSSLIRQEWGTVKYAKPWALSAYIRKNFEDVRNLTSEVKGVIEWCMNSGIRPDEEKRILFAAKVGMAGRKDVNEESVKRVGEVSADMLKRMVQRRWASELGLDHMHSCYLPWLYGWKPRFPVAFGLVDEGQDQSGPQAYMSTTMGKRLALVGDEYQAIYGWRGAHNAVMEWYRQRTNATQCQLTLSFRCAKLIGAEAKQIVPAFRCSRDDLGNVVTESYGKTIPKMGPGDAVVSRTNAALVPIWAKLLSMAVPCRILGRDLFGKVEAALNKTRVDAFKPAAKQALQQLEASILEKTELGVESRTDQDTADTLFALLDVFDTDGMGCKQVIDTLKANSEYKPQEGSKFEGVELSTVHQAKGLEWDNVYMLIHTFRDEPGQHSEETNLRYVAITRARNRLVYTYPDVEEKGANDVQVS